MCVCVTVNVKVGQRVEKGEALITLSAMKMETVVTAVKGGVVRRVAAEAGDSLAAGSLLPPSRSPSLSLCLTLCVSLCLGDLLLVVEDEDA